MSRSKAALREFGKTLRGRRSRLFLLGLAAALAAVVFFYFGNGGDGRSGGWRWKGAPSDGSARAFMALPQYYTDDQTAREALFALLDQGFPAVARVTRMDAAGTWSRLYLGPFATDEEAAEAFEALKQHPVGPAGTASPDPDPETAARPRVLVELGRPVRDEDLWDELDVPHSRNIYAFARTAVVSDGADRRRALNRLCLGPFATEDEAQEALARLADWDPATDFTLRNLEVDDE